MSGHSKWKTIQHKKGAADAKRGKIFSRLSKEITIAARSGGNPDMNPALRTAVSKAREANMPADNIDRAIKKGTGELEGAQLEEAVYEGYISGVAVVVQVLTDNRNRAASEIRHVFTKFGTNLAQQGAVSRGFQRKGQIMVESSAIDEDKLMTVALDSGADDMTTDDNMFEIITEPSAYDNVVGALEKEGISTVSSEVSLIPDAFVPVNEKDTAGTVMRFVEALEDLDDVQNVYTNMDLSPELLKEMEGE